MLISNIGTMLVYHIVFMNIGSICDEPRLFIYIALNFSPIVDMPMLPWVIGQMNVQMWN